MQYRALLDAEWAAYNKKHDEAVHTYNVAVLMSERRGLVHDAALANQRISDRYRRVGNHAKAREHMDQAKAMYTEWGALAVSKQLEGSHLENACR